VLDGVSAGDWIVAAGGHLLRAGEVVAPVDRDNRPVAQVVPAPAVAARKH
jgi:multidrug efflux system membrane fusion protein